MVRSTLLSALVWKPVHQIDVDRANAGVAQGDNGSPCHLEGLRAADGCLHVRIEILHPDGGPGQPGFAKSFHLPRVEMARIDLDRKLRPRADVEPGAKLRCEHENVAGREDIRRAAAPMDMGHRMTRRRQGGDVGNLHAQEMEVAGDRRMLARGLGIAAAVPAKAVAERNMDVERELGAFLQLGQPTGGRAARRHAGRSVAPWGSWCSGERARRISRPSRA